MTDFDGATPESLARALMRPTTLKVIAGGPGRPLVIAGVEIPCFVLEDETRVLVQRGLATGIGMSNPSGVQVHRFASSSSMKTLCFQ